MHQPNDDDPERDLEPFSSKYAIVEGVRVFTWNDDLAVMDYELYNGLAGRVGEPVLGRVGGLTYEFIPSRQVPAESVNIPADRHNGTTPDTLLVQK